MKSTPQDAIANIAALDAVLSVHTEAWQDAAPDKKQSWWEKINALLDQRLAAMARRDSGPQSLPVSKSPGLPVPSP